MPAFHRLVPVLPVVLVLAACGDSGADKGAQRPAPPEATATPIVEVVDTSAEPTPAPKVPDNSKRIPTIKGSKGTPPTELTVRDLEVGNGPQPTRGQTLYVDYVGAHYDTGKPFESTWETGRPFPFIFGANQIVPGIDRGMEGMKVGGRRELIVPPELAYGDHGIPGQVYSNETLVYVVDLLAAH